MSLMDCSTSLMLNSLQLITAPGLNSVFVRGHFEVWWFNRTLSERSRRRYFILLKSFPRMAVSAILCNSVTRLTDTVVRNLLQNSLELAGGHFPKKNVFDMQGKSNYFIHAIYVYYKPSLSIVQADKMACCKEQPAYYYSFIQLS
ncbi:hypothetical protein J6590_054053 [Homalodisca vitripennis]|nr:hypothetical protein J6590_054053 [Homalodisca vitripennis]